MGPGVSDLLGAVYLSAEQSLPEWFRVGLDTGAFALLTYVITILGPRLLKEERVFRENQDRRFSHSIARLEHRWERRWLRQEHERQASLERLATRIVACLGEVCKASERRDMQDKPEEP